MGSVVVVMVLEFIQRLLKFVSIGVNSSAKEFVPQLIEEALDSSVLPGLAGLYEACLDPLRKRERPEFRAVVRDDPPRFAVDEEQPFEFSLDFEGGKRGSRFEQQALSGEAVEHGEDPRDVRAWVWPG